jgi:hypothetical protein
MNKEYSPARMIVEAARRNLAEAQAEYIEELCAQASANSSWLLHKELDGFTGKGKNGDPEFVHYDEKDHQEVMARYKSAVERHETNVKRWQEALSCALDRLCN